MKYYTTIKITRYIFKISETILAIKGCVRISAIYYLCWKHNKTILQIIYGHISVNLQTLEKYLPTSEKQLFLGWEGIETT